jgi:hypothetical protein
LAKLAKFPRLAVGFFNAVSGGGQKSSEAKASSDVIFDVQMMASPNWFRGPVFNRETFLENNLVLYCRIIV